MNVLILDDEMLYRDYVSLRLEQYGVNTFPASSLEEAQTNLNRVDIDFCILDYWLKPGEQGDRVLEFLNEHRREIPCVFFTSDLAIRLPQDQKIVGVFGKLEMEFMLDQFRNFFGMRFPKQSV